MAVSRKRLRYKQQLQPDTSSSCSSRPQQVPSFSWSLLAPLLDTRSLAQLMCACRDVVHVARRALAAERAWTRIVRPVHTALGETQWPGKALLSEVPDFGALTFGLSRAVDGSHVLSNDMVGREEFLRVLTDMIKTSRPQHTFTTIAVNRNSPTWMVQDNGMRGPCLAICFGDFDGGELWIEESAPVDDAVVEDVVWNGVKMKGRVESAKNRWVDFEAHKHRQVKPFQGTRISVVFYSIAAAERARPNDLKQLQQLGFNLPTENWQRQEEPAKASKQKLDEMVSRLHNMGCGRTEALRTLLEYCKCHADRIVEELAA